MGKNQSASNLTNIIKQDASGNISFMSGSTMLMSLSNTGQVSGSSPAVSAISSSYALNATNAVSAISATTATTASYATNFTVTGNLTAQTLVVQTITSSVDFVTGSTRFGSVSGNTHQFTGSVGISGALSGTSATFSTFLGVGASTQRDPSGTRSLTISGVSSGYAASLDLYATRNYAIYTGGGGQLGFYDLTAGAERLTIASTGAATFSSSVTATTLALGSVTPSSNGIYLNVASANGANYGYIRTNALTVNTTQLILGSTYGYNTPVDALTIYNGAATFAGSVTSTSFIGGLYAPTYNNGTTFINFYDNMGGNTSRAAIIYNSADSPTAGGMWSVQFVKWDGAYGSMTALNMEPGTQTFYVKTLYGGSWSSWVQK